jgi:pyruvate dehydrogenase E2 component (dihydrolipoamide acetyltransferase)
MTVVPEVAGDQRVEVKIPVLGQGMESGTIVRWLKSEGDAVRKREPLYELDTDKVTQEVEAEADGVLLKILVEAGEVVVGTTVALIGAPGDTLAGAPEPQPPPPAAEPEREAAPEPDLPAPGRAATAPPASEQENGRVKASPLARRIARERGVDLRGVTGTGPDGRIVAEDVEQAAAAPAPAAPAPAAVPAAATPGIDVEVVPLTSTRRTIARRLTEAWTAPVFHLAVSAEMTEAIALRERLVARLRDGEARPTVSDVVVRLVAVALERHPAVNATFHGDAVHRSRQVNVGLAVAAPAGLVVPVIRDAERLSIREIAAAREDVVGRARDGKLTLQDFEGGTFTVSNLGMYGIEEFTAVLNPPQVAILAVGAIKEQAIVVDGEIDVAPIMRMQLTCDHRAIDGAEGAEFLRTLVELVEHPALAL